MSCSHREHHVDLALGLLDEERSATLLEAIRGCECAEDYALLETIEGASMQLMSAPPPEIEADLMQLARETAAKTRIKNAQADSDQAKVTSKGGFWGWLDKLTSSFGPQFAMTTVMLLVIAVGVWYVPDDRSSSDGLGSTVALSDPEGEAVATALEGEAETVETATLEEAEEAETIEVGGDEEPAGGAASLRASAEESAPDEPALAESEAPGSELADAPNAEQTVVASNTAQTQSEPTSARSSNALGTMERGRALTGGSAPTVMGISQEGVGGLDSTDQETYAGQARAWQEEMSVGDAPAPVVQTRSTSSRPSVDDADDAPAQAEMAETRTLSVSQTLLRLARNHRSGGNCRQATSQYEELLRRFPRAAEVPPALMESADCYARNGFISRAITNLERATSYASVRIEARRELARLRTVQAMQRRQVEALSPAAEPASAPASFD